MEFLFLHIEVTGNISSQISMSNKEAGKYGSCKKDTRKKKKKKNSNVTELYVAAENMQSYTVSMYGKIQRLSYNVFIEIDTLIFTRVVLNCWKHSALVSLACFHFRDDVQ